MDMFFEGVCGAAILTVVFVVREGLADLATEKDFEELYKQGLQLGRAALPREQRGQWPGAGSLRRVYAEQQGGCLL